MKTDAFSIPCPFVNCGKWVKSKGGLKQHIHHKHTMARHQPLLPEHSLSGTLYTIATSLIRLLTYANLIFRLEFGWTRRWGPRWSGSSLGKKTSSFDTEIPERLHFEHYQCYHDESESEFASPMNLQAEDVAPFVPNSQHGPSCHDLPEVSCSLLVDFDGLNNEGISSVYDFTFWFSLLSNIILDFISSCAERTPTTLAGTPEVEDEPRLKYVYHPFLTGKS